MSIEIDFYDAWSCVGRPLNSHPKLPCEVADLHREMRRCHVGRALVSVAEPKWWDPVLANRHLDALGGEGLSPIWMALPGDAGDFPKVTDFIDLLDQKSVSAVQILPRTQQWNPFGRSADKLFHALAEGAWPIFVQLGEELNMREMEELAQRHPNNRWIITHGGWDEQRALLGLMRETENICMTLERYHANFGIEHLHAEGLDDRLLFASNAPSASMGAARAYLDWAQIPLESKAAIAGRNLTKLLRRPQSDRLSGFYEPDSIIQDCMEGRPLNCGAIDCHSHILQDGLHSGGLPVMLKGDASGLLEMGRITGVEQIGVMTWVGIQTLREDEGHEVVKKAIESWPESFWGLATVQVADRTDAQKIEVLESLRRGRRLLGLKPYPTFGIAYDNPRYDALWSYAEREGLYVGIHPYHWYRPDEFISICERFPNLRIFAYHAGCSYEIADTIIELCHRFPNLNAEINYSSVTGGVIDYLVEHCGADRVFYGSDQPLRDPRQQLGWVVYSGLKEEDKAAVLAGNARRFLAEIEG